MPTAAALHPVMKIFGSVVAPTTLLTALMYYFGRTEYAGFLHYLGADVTVLDFTVEDYLNNSVDSLIMPLSAFAGIALLALWCHQLVRALPARLRRIVLRLLIPVTAIAGIVLVSLAAADVVTGAVFTTATERRGLSLSIGVLLLAYAAHLIRQLLTEPGAQQPPQHPAAALAVAEWAMVFVLVSVGLFWAVGSYAANLGQNRAYELLERPSSSRPDVVAYSEKRLNLQAPGVREITCQDPNAAYRFRYDGLKLIWRIKDQYLLLPAGWTHTNGTTLLIPHSDKIRLEFSPPGQVRNATC
jgi:hypothetical protein